MFSFRPTSRFASLFAAIADAFSAAAIRIEAAASNALRDLTLASLGRPEAIGPLFAGAAGVFGCKCSWRSERPIGILGGAAPGLEVYHHRDQRAEVWGQAGELHGQTKRGTNVRRAKVRPGKCG